jgi:hypothetical protein
MITPLYIVLFPVQNSISLSDILPFQASFPYSHLYLEYQYDDWRTPSKTNIEFVSFINIYQVVNVGPDPTPRTKSDQYLGLHGVEFDNWPHWSRAFCKHECLTMNG